MNAATLNPRPGFARRILLVGLTLLQVVSNLAQLSSFTYEGKLNDDGVPANGNFDFQFTLRDAVKGGNLIGAPVAVAPTPVVNGQFTLSLDFGANAFTGAARWLELRVRTNGAATAYVLLSPRQPISPTPYALFAMTPAGPKGETGPQGLPGTTSASGILSGTLADARLSVNVAFKNDLTTLSNGISARLIATNAALVAENKALKSQLTALSNSVVAAVPPGSVAMSTDADDAVLSARGYVSFSSIAADGWANASPQNAPAGRTMHSTVWTGAEMIVWGGFLAANTLSGGGGRYSPATDEWTGISTFSAPTQRALHSGVWTGDEMIVWGGSDGGGFLNTGGHYRPSTQMWSPTESNGAPAGRSDHVCVWIGNRMIVWGGRGSAGHLSDGASYDSTSKQWTPLPMLNAPAPRRGATAVWTGNQLLIWGGEGQGGALASGARLSFGANGVAQSWNSMATSASPTARIGHTAIWTGQRMVVWGGTSGNDYFADGAAYDPAFNRWSALPSEATPAGRSGHVAVWTGSEMLIFGGENGNTALASGGAYNPISNKWRALTGKGNPIARAEATAAWTGQELLTFGGTANGQVLGFLQRLNPQPLSYLYRKL